MQATSIADAIGTGDRKREETVAAALTEGPEKLIGRLEGEMLEAAKNLEFEKAASLRDRIDEIVEALAMARGDTPPANPGPRHPKAPRRRAHRFGGPEQ